MVMTGAVEGLEIKHETYQRPTVITASRLDNGGLVYCDSIKY